MSPEKLRALAAELEATARRLRDQAAELEAAASLPDGVKARILNNSGMFSAEHKVNMSRVKLRNPRNKLAAAAHAAVKPDGTKGYSFVALAKAVGVSAALLTLAYNGDRAMPRHAAEKIEKLIGYPVTAWKRLS